MENTEYWQCSHTRKCKWIGEHKELGSTRNTEHLDVCMSDSVCPKCGNKEFYVLDENEYLKLKAK